MITLFRFIIFIAVSAVCIFFALSNQDTVAVTWSPISEAINIPAYILALGGLATGFIIGVLITWLNFIPVRFENRKNKKLIHKLEKELENYVEHEDEGTNNDLMISTQGAQDDI